MNSLRSLLPLVILVILAPLHAHQPCRDPHLPFDPPFSCIPRRIDAASGGSIIGGCANEIRLCVGKPLAPKHVDAPDSSPVRLYRVLGDPVLEDVFAEHTVHWYPDSTTGSIVVIPDPPLIVTDGDPARPVVYRLVTDCRFWQGREHQGVDTSYIDLWKQHVVRVKGAAHRLHDGVRISEEVIVSPGPSVATAFAANGVTLAAEDTERYRFDHWSCSVDIEGFDPVLPAQRLSEVCWPLEDTVHFTAWYRDVTAGVADAEIRDTRAVVIDGHLRITSASKPISTLAVADLYGRLYAWRELQERFHTVELPFAHPPGVYVVVIRTGALTTLHPLLHSP